MCTLCQRLWSRKKRWVVFVRLFFLTAHTHSVRHSLLHFAVKFSGELFKQYSRPPHSTVSSWLSLKVERMFLQQMGILQQVAWRAIEEHESNLQFSLLMAKQVGQFVARGTWSYSWSNFRWYQDTTAESWPHMAPWPSWPPRREKKW